MFTCFMVVGRGNYLTDRETRESLHGFTARTLNCDPFQPDFAQAGSAWTHGAKDGQHDLVRMLANVRFIDH
jgi:hypothetical protein